jgi:hypothetical protein
MPLPPTVVNTLGLTTRCSVRYPIKVGCSGFAPVGTCCLLPTKKTIQQWEKLTMLVLIRRRWESSNSSVAIGCENPHGGLRTFHHKSTCLDAINFRALFGANLVTLPPKIWGE